MLDFLISLAPDLALWVLISIPVAVVTAGFCALNSRADEWGEPEAEEENLKQAA